MVATDTRCFASFCAIDGVLSRSIFCSTSFTSSSCCCCESCAFSTRSLVWLCSRFALISAIRFIARTVFCHNSLSYLTGTWRLNFVGNNAKQPSGLSTLAREKERGMNTQKKVSPKPLSQHWIIRTSFQSRILDPPSSPCPLLSEMLSSTLPYADYASF